jgi:L-alanine-DL-glutamate epimerase-like enolase superfamily enzyme
VTFGSNLELGIGAAALAQVATVCPRLSSAVPADLIGPLYFESALVLDASFVGWTGAKLPAGPGLGIDLDRETLARYAFSPTAGAGEETRA